MINRHNVKNIHFDSEINVYNKLVIITMKPLSLLILIAQPL